MLIAHRVKAIRTCLHVAADGTRPVGIRKMYVGFCVDHSRLMAEQTADVGLKTALSEYATALVGAESLLHRNKLDEVRETLREALGVLAELEAVISTPTARKVAL